MYVFAYMRRFGAPSSKYIYISLEPVKAINIGTVPSNTAHTVLVNHVLITMPQTRT